MTRDVLVATLAIVVTLAVSGLYRGRALDAPAAEAVATAVPGPAAAVPPSSVQIDQQLVHARLVSAGAAPAPRATRAAARRTQKTGVMARARRAIFGEGRHKPAPFPVVQ